MAFDRSNQFESGDRGDRGDRPRRGRRRCDICLAKPLVVDYKNISALRRFLNEHGQIEGRRKVGCSAECQRAITTAVKRARQVALLPYTSEHVRVSGVAVGRPAPTRR